MFIAIKILLVIVKLLGASLVIFGASSMAALWTFTMVADMLGFSSLSEEAL